MSARLGAFFDAFIGSGRVIDLILLLTALEAAALTLLHHGSRRGVPPGDFIVNLVSGCMLLLAMRAYVSAAWWGWTALCLLLAGIAHAVDIARRWRA